MRKILSFLMGFSMAFIAHSQTINVSGKVVDGTGQSIPNTSVQLRNGSKGTVTGMDGQFSINVSVGSTLLISSVGYETKEVKITASTPSPLMVTLLASTSSLSEVVVT